MRDGPFLTKTDLFEAGKGGYNKYRIPGLVVTPRGAVLAYCEARESGDWGLTDIQMRRSTDGGITWATPRRVMDFQRYGAGPVHNFTAISDLRSGLTHFLYCFNYTRAFHMTSADDGETLSEPEEITPIFEAYRPRYPWNVIGIGPGHGIQLRPGRLLATVWLSTGGRKHRPSAVSSLFSEDGGRSWRLGDLIAVHSEALPNPNESVPVELADGRVLFNIRNESPRARRLISISPDGATNWSAPAFDEALLEPVCMGSILRLNWPAGAERGRILFANPNTLDISFPGARPDFRDRKNVTVRLSYDECRTWPVAKALEPGPSGYSDLALAPQHAAAGGFATGLAADGAMLCFYEAGTDDSTVYGTARLVLARFNPAWLTDGRDLGPNAASLAGQACRGLTASESPLHFRPDTL